MLFMFIPQGGGSGSNASKKKGEGSSPPQDIEMENKAVVDDAMVEGDVERT